MRSFDTPVLRVSQPSSWVVRHAHLVRPGGPVLDLACGEGRHARFLAGRGHPVTAVDIDTGGAAALAGLPGIQFVQADVESGPWPLGNDRFAGIVITNYLHRPLFSRLPDLLEDGGVLLIETFAAGNERLGRPRNPDFLLAAGELLAAVAPTLQVVAYEHGIEQWPRPAVRQRIVAVRGTEPVELPPVRDAPP